ncbi:MAG: ABC transporter permease subunit [Clostridia bacterium]|nr:ABC transporter permease subunit [Clostridia bacterium]MBQ9133203.1 ABC transporter permease subunit [Clostridia bacterium]
MQTKIKKLLTGAAVLVLWLAVWQVCAMCVGREIILPTPLSVFGRFFALAKTAPFWKATALSLCRIMSGYAAGVVIGALLGAAMYFVPPVRAMFSPFLTVVKSTPVASFILIAYFIITDTAIPVFITFLMVLPMMASSVFTSLGSTDKALLEMTKVYKISFGKKLKTLYIPTVLPHFLGQALTALGFGWKAGIAAEVLCTPRNSIGKYLYDSKTYLETVDTFAYTLLVIIISLALEKCLKKLLGRVKGVAA